MNYQKIQQGDVLLLKVTKEEFQLQRLNYRTTEHDVRALLQHGEGTGHAHAIYMEDLLDNAGITLCKQQEYQRSNQGLIVTGAPVELRHEEHNTITLEPGYYIQKIVREYDHISGRSRGVID